MIIVELRIDRLVDQSIGQSIGQSIDRCAEPFLNMVGAMVGVTVISQWLVRKFQFEWRQSKRIAVDQTNNYWSIVNRRSSSSHHRSSTTSQHCWSSSSLFIDTPSSIDYLCHQPTSINHCIDPSIRPSIHRSIDQSIHRSIDQLIHRSIDRSIHQPLIASYCVSIRSYSACVYSLSMFIILAVSIDRSIVHRCLIPPSLIVRLALLFNLKLRVRLGHNQ